MSNSTNLNEENELFRVKIGKHTNQQLLTLMMAHNHGVTDLSKLVSCDKATVSKILHNKIQVPFLLAMKISNIYKVDSRVIWRCRCFKGGQNEEREKSVSKN